MMSERRATVSEHTNSQFNRTPLISLHENTSTINSGNNQEAFCKYSESKTKRELLD